MHQLVINANVGFNVAPNTQKRHFPGVFLTRALARIIFYHVNRCD